MEDRQKTRVLFHVKASIKYNNATIEGDVDNLSINGMFMNTEKNIPENTTADFSIHLSGSSSKLNLNIKGRVIRKEDNGIAVSFLEMDLDSYAHLKNIIAMNKTDENNIREEFEKIDFK